MMIVIILTPGCLINPPDIFYRIYSSSSMNGNDFTVLLGIGSRVLSQNIINISLLDWSFLLKIDNLKTIIIAFMNHQKKKMEAKMDEAAGYICDFLCDSGKMCNVYLNF